MCEHVRAHYFASVGVFLYTCHTHDNRHTVVTGDEGQLREGGGELRSKLKHHRNRKRLQRFNQIKKNKKAGKSGRRMARRMKRIDGES